MVRDHTELDVWKLCDELSDRVHEITSRPTFTDEKLRGQLNEAVDSPCPNVGEGFSRYYPGTMLDSSASQKARLLK